MGKKNGWFSKAKKAISQDSKWKKAERKNGKWLGKEIPLVTETTDSVNEVPHPPFVPTVEEVKLIEVENELEINQVEPVSVSTAEPSQVSAIQESPAVSQSTQLTGKSEEVAAVQIQTAFRSYMARKRLRSVRGFIRLKSLISGPFVKRQTSNTLKSMQALSRLQSQIQLTRIRMLEENRALQRQLLHKRAKELESLKIGEDWDDSLRSKEKIEQNLLQKYEAATRRERALAYSYTHQQTWKKCSKPINLLFMDPTNPQWGWSSLERWMVPYSLETTKSIAHKELSGDLPYKALNSGEITEFFARYQLNSEHDPSNSTPASQKPTSSNHPSAVKSSSKMVRRKIKNLSPKQGLETQLDDSKHSCLSDQSDKNRRHTIAGSSVDEAESIGSSASVPSYMASTHSAKAKLKCPSPLGVENRRPSEKPSTGMPKKRLSFPPSPAPFRKVET